MLRSSRNLNDQLCLIRGFKGFQGPDLPELKLGPDTAFSGLGQPLGSAGHTCRAVKQEGVGRLILVFRNVLAAINTLHLARYGRSNIVVAAVTLQLPITQETILGCSGTMLANGVLRSFTCDIPSIPYLGGHSRVDLQANDKVPISPGQPSSKVGTPPGFYSAVKNTCSVSQSALLSTYFDKLYLSMLTAMNNKSAEVYELNPVPPVGPPIAASKHNVVPSQSRGLKVSKGLDCPSILQF
jgi:hypothetical protein